MLKGNDFLSIQDISAREMGRIFEKAALFKRRPLGRQLKGKILVMLFAKPSTRTRVSFEVAINQLGGDDIFLPMDEVQMARGETIEDTGKVLGRYCDGMVARLFSHQTLVTLAENSPVPVINGLTDLLHPCQALADLFTIQEKLGRLGGVKVAFVGDGNNNVTHSLLHACTKMGVDISVGCPKGYGPQKEVLSEALSHAKKSGSTVEVLQSPREAVKGADIVYTDTWVSMGEESQMEKRLRVFRPYQLNKQLLRKAKREALVMHDLPAHRGFEITAQVMEGKQSIIFDQAENRLHVEKALLALIFG